MDLGLEGKVALVTASSKGLGRATALALSQEGPRSCCAPATRRPWPRRPRPCPARPWPSRPTSPTRRPRSGWSTPPSTASARSTSWSPTPAARPRPRPRGRRRRAPGGRPDQPARSIRLVRAALPPMRAAGWGRICLITSKAVKEPIPTLALSNTARAGLWAWAKTAAADLFDERITLNLACPGIHDTDRARQTGMLARPGRRPGRLRQGGVLPVLGPGRVHQRHRPPGRRRHHRRPAVARRCHAHAPADRHRRRDRLGQRRSRHRPAPARGRDPRVDPGRGPGRLPRALDQVLAPSTPRGSSRPAAPQRPDLHEDWESRQPGKGPVAYLAGARLTVRLAGRPAPGRWPRPRSRSAARAPGCTVSSWWSAT